MEEGEKVFGKVEGVMGEGVRVIGWGNGVGVDVARSIWVGEVCSSPRLFFPPSVKLDHQKYFLSYSYTCNLNP